MTLTPEQRAAIEERHQKRHHPDIDIRYPQLVADHVSDMAKDISDLLEALREAEEQRDRALDQVAAAYAGLAECCSCDDTEEICPCCEVRKLISKTAQAHAARLEQKGREEERARIVKWAYEMAGPESYPLHAFEIEQFLKSQQPTDAAEGGENVL